MSGLSRTPGKRVYDESRTVGSNPTLSAIISYKSMAYVINYDSSHNSSHKNRNPYFGHVNWVAEPKLVLPVALHTAVAAAIPLPVTKVTNPR